MNAPDHAPDPYRPRVREVRLCEEAVEFSAYSPDEVFATCTNWITAQRQISTEWTIVGTDWHFETDEHGMRYTLGIRIERTSQDGILADGSRPTLADRLPWPPADAY